MTSTNRKEIKSSNPTVNRDVEGDHTRSQIQMTSGFNSRYGSTGSCDELLKSIVMVLNDNLNQDDTFTWVITNESCKITVKSVFGIELENGYDKLSKEVLIGILRRSIWIDDNTDAIPESGYTLMEFVEFLKGMLNHRSGSYGDPADSISSEYLYPKTLTSSCRAVTKKIQTDINIKSFVTDIKNLDLNDIWTGGPTASIRGSQINQGGQLEGSINTGEDRLPSGVSGYDSIQDVFPDKVYSEEQLAQYTIRPWLTPLESTEAGISVLLDGVILHPRHWRYAAGNGLIVFMDNTIHTGGVEVNLGLLGESKALWFLPKWMREGKHGSSERSTYAYKLSDEYLELLQADIDAGTMKVYVIEPRVSPNGIEWRSAIEKLLSGKVMIMDYFPGGSGDGKVAIAGRGMTKHILKYGISGGIPIGNIDVSSSYSNAMTSNQGFDTYSFESGVPEAVKGNSRQKIIDNGKISWPAAKSRKGNRKIK